MMALEYLRVAINHGLRGMSCRFCRVVDQWQQTLSQHSQIPVHDAGLVVPSVAALTIDRAEACLGVKMVHECAGTEIDGLTAQ